MQKGMGLILAGLVAASILAVTPAAFAGSAKHGGGVQKQGRCDANSTWKLKAKPDNARLEVEFEVDQNVSGDTWNVRLRDNGMTFFKGTRVTVPPSGSFTVHRFTANQAGTDTITARAANQRTGEVCRAALTIEPRRSAHEAERTRREQAEAQRGEAGEGPGSGGMASEPGPSLIRERDRRGVCRRSRGRGC